MGRPSTLRTGTFRADGPHITNCTDDHCPGTSPPKCAAKVCVVATILDAEHPQVSPAARQVYDKVVRLKPERERHVPVDRWVRNCLVISARSVPPHLQSEEVRSLKLPFICLGVAVALLATAAFAQAPPPALPGGPRPPTPGVMPAQPPSPSKGAHFRIEQGENMVDVKCADDEPTRACTDIAMQFLDRLGITQSRTTGAAPR